MAKRWMCDEAAVQSCIAVFWGVKLAADIIFPLQAYRGRDRLQHFKLDGSFITAVAKPDPVSNRTCLRTAAQSSSGWLV